MVSKKDRKKYSIESTSDGFPDFELALNKGVEAIGWKDFSCFIVRWCNEHQPTDTPYSLPFWQKEMPLKRALERRPKNKKLDA